MTKTKGLILGCVAVVLLGGVVATTVGGDVEPATVHPAEGGEWDYGATAGRTWSNFQHDSSHSATVHGHEFVDTGCVQGGTWARAQAPQRWISILGNQQNKSVCENVVGAQ